MPYGCPIDSTLIWCLWHHAPGYVLLLTLLVVSWIIGSIGFRRL